MADGISVGEVTNRRAEKTTREVIARAGRHMAAGNIRVAIFITSYQSGPSRGRRFVNALRSILNTATTIAVLEHNRRQKERMSSRYGQATVAAMSGRLGTRMTLNRIDVELPFRPIHLCKSSRSPSSCRTFLPQGTVPAFSGPSCSPPSRRRSRRLFSRRQVPPCPR
jgi:hypothetical protein